jgi:hypothetical protein
MATTQKDMRELRKTLAAWVGSTDGDHLGDLVWAAAMDERIEILLVRVIRQRRADERAARAND